MRKLISKLFWPIVVVGIIVAIAYGYIPEPIRVETATAKQGSLQVTVDDDGETRVREKYIVSAPVSGKMLRVTLEAGDVVIGGKTEIAQIKPNDPVLLDVRTRAEAQARVRTAEAATLQASAAITRAKEALKLAEHDNKRAKSLRRQKAMSQADADAAEYHERMARADVRSAEFAAKVAAYEIDQANAALRFTEPSDAEDAEVEAFRLIAPVDGRVLNVLSEDSKVVSAGMSLVELGDTKDMEMIVDVLSTDAVKIRVGDQVHIEHWGGDKELQGTVRRVEPAAFLKVSALGVEEKRVNVIIDFNEPLGEDDSLGDGFRIEARIVVDETDMESIKVPSGTLFRESGAWYVFKVVDQTAKQIAKKTTKKIAKKTVVEVGLSNGLETEVISGVEDSDILISHPSDLIQDGAEVAPFEK